MFDKPRLPEDVSDLLAMVALDVEAEIVLGFRIAPFDAIVVLEDDDRIRQRCARKLKTRQRLAEPLFRLPLALEHPEHV